MTEKERRDILAEMAEEEARRAIRAASRRLGDGAPAAELCAAGKEAAEDCLRKSGASDMIPVGVELLADPRHPDNPRKTLLKLTGKLFGDA